MGLFDKFKTGLGKSSSGVADGLKNIFSTKKNIIKVFYDIFLKNNFLSSLTPKETNNEVIYEKMVQLDSTKVNLKIIFEIRPLLLRKIISKTEDDLISISFFDHNYNKEFEKDFFSFVPIYLD